MKNSKLFILLGFVSTCFLSQVSIATNPVVHDIDRVNPLELVVNNHAFLVEQATTPAQLEKGLKYRKFMPWYQGMVFNFMGNDKQCFWNKDTYLSLSIAFLDKTGLITQIVDMKPNSSNQYCSDEGVASVIEMNQGWFEKHQVKVGMRVYFSRVADFTKIK